MNEKDREYLRRMAEAQERIAGIFEKQQPGRISQIIAMGATVATTFGIVNIIDIIKNWIGG
jgi:hypothetical protein